MNDFHALYTAFGFRSSCVGGVIVGCMSICSEAEILIREFMVTREKSPGVRPNQAFFGRSCLNG